MTPAMLDALEAEVRYTRRRVRDCLGPDELRRAAEASVSLTVASLERDRSAMQRVEIERFEVEVHEARASVLGLYESGAGGPELAGALARWSRAERGLVDARRSAREAEATFFGVTP